MVGDGASDEFAFGIACLLAQADTNHEALILISEISFNLSDNWTFQQQVKIQAA